MDINLCLKHDLIVWTWLQENKQGPELFRFVSQGGEDRYVQINSAIEASLNIPLGWEALDDGKKLRFLLG
jgi:hypothetical protein